MTRPVFPVGATLDDGRIRITQRIVGERWLGRYRALDDDGQRYLVATGGSQSVTYPDLVRTLALPAPGIAPLVHVGPLSGGDPRAHRFDGLVEVEPPGQALSEVALRLPPAVGLDLARQLGQLLVGLQARDILLGRLPLELVHVTRRRFRRHALVVTGLAPRAARFWRTATMPEFALADPFTYPMAAPEVLWGHEPGPAADTYLLGLVTATLVGGVYPFTGDSYGGRMISLQLGREPGLALPPALEALVRRALAPAVEDRVALAELVDGLASARV